MNKYLVALISIGLAALTVIQTFGVEEPSAANLVQVALAVVVAFGQFFVPLLKGQWAAGGKTLVAVVGAGLAAVIPLLVEGNVTPDQWIVVGFIALQALGAEVGVAARQDPQVGVNERSAIVR